MLLRGIKLISAPKALDAPSARRAAYPSDPELSLRPQAWPKAAAPRFLSSALVAIALEAVVAQRRAAVFEAATLVMVDVRDEDFVASGHGLTFGEMEPQEKLDIGHRADAFAKLVAACFP